MADAQLKSKLVMCNVPTVDSEKSRRFYSALLGSEDFVRAPKTDVETYYQPISRDGIDLSITQRYDDNESWTCYFAVEDVERSIEELSSYGAEVVHKPQEVPSAEDSEIGRFAVVLDPDRNHVGLIELRPDAQKYFGLGESRELRPEQLERPAGGYTS
jgi:predicted enzyme related to lactoylglutathione lyase